MIPQPASHHETRRETGLAPPQPRGERWRHVFGFFQDYWTSKDWKFAWGALLFLIAVQFAVTYGFLLANRWQQNFFNSVEQRQASRFVPLMLTFAGIMALQIGTTLADTFVGMKLSIRWRTYLTGRYLSRYMALDRFIEIERLQLIDNPDQRIADDINRITANNTGILSIALAVLNAVIGSITFGMVLMQTAETIQLPLFGRTLSIPGSTIWYALIYAAIGSLLMAWIGRPYVRAQMRLQHREGDLRSGLIHIRRNAPQIGFARTQRVEETGLSQAFGQIRLAFNSLILSRLGISVGQGIYDRVGGILPLFLLVPRYFNGAISFGQIMSGRDAFQSMVGYLSYFIQGYSLIGERVADVNRLKALDDAINHERPRGIDFTSAGMPNDVAMAATGLALRRPHGEPLLDVGDWTVRAGERWLVQGPSGAGKSTLLRAMAGLWSDGNGHVAMVDDRLAMFVPQRLYLPLGTLKAALCFPDAPQSHDDDTIIALLQRVRLGEHAGHLHELRPWQDELSPGEQQRVALARILLHRPGLLVLDEATSALDPDNARYFHEQMLADLPDVTLVSVVHDEALRTHHTHILTIADGIAWQDKIGELRHAQ